jgi:cytochrome P450
MAAACGAGYLVAGEWLIRRLFAHYGPIVSIPLPGIPVVLIKDPAMVKQVFTEKPDVLLGGKGVRPSALIYGTDSMFVQEEPEHLRRRKLLTPPLHGKALENYRPIIENCTREAIASWPKTQPFEMLRAARDLMLDVIVRVMFGAEDPTERARLGRPFETLLDLGSSQQLILRVALHSIGGLKSWPALDRANQGIDDLLTPMIAARRNDSMLEHRTDIMSLLLTARGDEGEALTDKEIRDDLVTLVLAGHETTATTLAWMVDLLLHHPDELAAVQKEADAAESTAYIQAVINEPTTDSADTPFRHGPASSRTSAKSISTRRPMTVPSSSVRRASSMPVHPPTPGFRSAAGSSGAWARVSASSNLPPSCRRCCAPAGSKPSAPARTARCDAGSSCFPIVGCPFATTPDRS